MSTASTGATTGSISGTTIVVAIGPWCQCHATHTLALANASTGSSTIAAIGTTAHASTGALALSVGVVATAGARGCGRTAAGTIAGPTAGPGSTIGATTSALSSSTTAGYTGDEVIPPVTGTLAYAKTTAAARPTAIATPSRPGTASPTATSTSGLCMTTKPNYPRCIGEPDAQEDGKAKGHELGAGSHCQ
jgi:hypothetical protein